MSGLRRDDRGRVWTPYGWVREEDWFRQMQQRTAVRRPKPPAPPSRWVEIAAAYLATGEARPTQLQVAVKLGRTEGTLRRWLHELGMRWTDVPARMRASK